MLAICIGNLCDAERIVGDYYQGVIAIICPITNIEYNRYLWWQPSIQLRYELLIYYKRFLFYTSGFT